MENNYIYEKWLKCEDYFVVNNLYEKAKKSIRFYEGNQWYDEHQPNYKNLPVYNFITPIVDYKVAMVAKNTMVINYSPLNYESNPDLAQMWSDICSELNQYAQEKWEELQMDTVVWDLVKSAAVTGCSYMFFGTKDLKPKLIDGTNVFLADEQEKDLQQQRFIIIRERQFVEDVRKAAKEYGLKDSELDMIQADAAENQINNEDNEVKSKDGKVTCYLYLSRDDNGNVTYARATRDIIYQKETALEGMTRYPMVDFVWNRKFNSARGTGEVSLMIPNQIETNRLLLRRIVNNKQSGYPRPVYAEQYIKNPEAIDNVGAKIIVRSGANVQDVANAFTYIQPAPMTSEGTVLQNEIIQTTRNLNNASDEATGNVNPEQASGKAISLVIDQNAVMLTEQAAMFKQVCEDVGQIWFNMWQVFEPNGMTMSWFDDEGHRQQGFIDGDQLETLEIRVRIDVSNNNPWSVYANDQEAMNMLGNGIVDFPQYVQLLSDQNHMKPKLKEFVREAQLQAMQQQEAQLQQMAQQQQAAFQQQLAGALMNGGGQNGMPQM